MAEARMYAQIDPFFPSMPTVGYSWLSLDWGWEYVNVPNPAALSLPPVVFERKRHQERWNVAYCDGHTETFTARRIWNYRDDDLLRLWNRDHQPHREWLHPGLQ